MFFFCLLFHFERAMNKKSVYRRVGDLFDYKRLFYNWMSQQFLPVSPSCFTWSGTSGSSSSTSMKTSPEVGRDGSPSNTNGGLTASPQRVTQVFDLTLRHRFCLTSPLLLFLLLLSLQQSLLLLLGAAVVLQEPDGALTDHGLPPKLTVVDDFDDDGGHVELLTGESLGKEGRPVWKLIGWRTG